MEAMDTREQMDVMADETRREAIVHSKHHIAQRKLIESSFMVMGMFPDGSEAKQDYFMKIGISGKIENECLGCPQQHRMLWYSLSHFGKTTDHPNGKGVCSNCLWKHFIQFKGVVEQVEPVFYK